MNSLALSLSLPSSLLRLINPPPRHVTTTHLRRRGFSPISAAPEEGQIPMMALEGERDWSFLSAAPAPEANRAAIIAAGEIGPGSRVMAWAPSEGFVDGLVGSGSSSLVVVHESILALAAIKEAHDHVRCWHGDLLHVPHKWPGHLFHAVFLYFLPALPNTLHHVFDAVSMFSLPGSRLVISHPQGRQVLEQQRREYPDVVVSDLPHKLALEKVASDHSFRLLDFVDQPSSFYLAVLTYCGSARD